MDYLGSVAELVDARDLKSLGESRVGSIPTTPTKILSSLIAQIVNIDRSEPKAMPPQATNTRDAETFPLPINNCVTAETKISDTIKCELGVSFGEYVKNLLTSDTIRCAARHKLLAIELEDNTYTRFTTARSKCYIFTQEQLKNFLREFEEYIKEGMAC